MKKKKTKSVKKVVSKKKATKKIGKIAKKTKKRTGRSKLKMFEKKCPLRISFMFDNFNLLKEWSKELATTPKKYVESIIESYIDHKNRNAKKECENSEYFLKQ